jgi:hypothetical protein
VFFGYLLLGIITLLFYVFQGCPHPRPKSVKVGEIGWDVASVREDHVKLWRSGHQIKVNIPLARSNCTGVNIGHNCSILKFTNEGPLFKTLNHTVLLLVDVVIFHQ